MRCCNYGATHLPRDKHGGDRLARRDRQRANQGRLRDESLVSRVMAQMLSPLQGGSISRSMEAPSELQILQQFSVTGFGEGKNIQSTKDQTLYVGIKHPTSRVEDNDADKNGNKNKQKGEITSEGS